MPEKKQHSKASFNGSRSSNIRVQIDEEWYHNADLMQLLKITDRTLSRYRKNGILPFKKIGGRIYYPKSYFNKTIIRSILVGDFKPIPE